MRVIDRSIDEPAASFNDKWPPALDRWVIVNVIVNAGRLRQKGRGIRPPRDSISKPRGRNSIGSGENCSGYLAEWGILWLSGVFSGSEARNAVHLVDRGVL